MATAPLAVALVLAGGAAAQPPTFAPSVPIDGPSAGIGALSGVSVARDGSGGLVYLKAVAGGQHVFVSRLQGGNFMAPEQIDGGLVTDSSQPVIAAGDGGLLLVAFVNAGGLYVVTRPASGSPYGSAQLLASGASDPALSLSVHAKGYLAFTVLGQGGHDVRAAYYRAGQWRVEAGALDAVPGDDAGAGSGRPRVAAAGDGVGIVVWGEIGHVFSRRLWGTSPSVLSEQADPPSVGGVSEIAADLPSVGAGDDSSYATVVFREQVAGSSGPQARAVSSRLRGSRYEHPFAVDGIPPGSSESGVGPQIAEGQYGHGFITAWHAFSNAIIGTQLGNSGGVAGIARADSLPNPSPPYAVPATAGFFSALIAWQDTLGVGGQPEIRARYFNGVSLEPEVVVSSPSFGPTDAASGLAAGGDIAGDAAVAWVQGSGAQRQIVVDQLYYPPAGFSGLGASGYIRTASPVLAWLASRDLWGPLTYTVSLDGAVIAQTAATSLRVPGPLSQGPHTWLVAVRNQAGVATAAPPLRFWVDTLAPTAQLSLTGPPRAGSSLRLRVRYSDVRPPLPASLASGVRSVVVTWGDGTASRIRHGALHRYRRPGRYRLRVLVRDRAGNATTIRRLLRIR